MYLFLQILPFLTFNHDLLWCHRTFETVLKMRFWLSTVPPARNGRGAGKPAYEVLDENAIF